ncbi:MAG: chemotaxis-specific protein-glutamate methyltransferase CheB [Myxococcales bacterium]|nr:chemotaxis-specific protein-glutamate methyltransferase CheB [Myxococcales bacterium]
MIPLRQPLRVLIADTSVALRRLIAGVLTELQGVSVVDIAATSELAIEQVVNTRPDVLVLDVNMDAVGVLESLQAAPRFPAVVLLASGTPRDVAASLEAIEAGAADVVTKLPRGSLESVLRQWIRDELAPRILAANPRRPERGAVDSLFTERARPGGGPRTPVIVPPQEELARVPPRHVIRIVAIGASTGGPKALAQILPALPADFPVPIVVVQHMPAAFTGLLAARLSSVSRLEVVEATTGEALSAGRVYIAPGNQHLLVSGKPDSARSELSSAPPENSCRPAVDVLFRSVGVVFGAASLGVVLTGMGQDGLLGATALRERGARVLAQDEATSIVWGMPGLVAKRGLAHKQVPLFRMAGEICDEVLGPPRDQNARFSCL